jgi:hypothetical protein
MRYATDHLSNWRAHCFRWVTTPTATFATRASIRGADGINKSKLVLLGGGLAVAVLFFVFTAVVGKSSKKQGSNKQPAQLMKQESAKQPKGTIVLLQWRSGDKKEVIAASLIAELWNGRVSDRIEIDRRTEQHNRLVETHNAEVEKTLALKSQSSEQEKSAAGNLSRGVRKVTEARGPTGNKGKSSEPLATQMNLPAMPDEDAGDLQQNNVLLQRRVEALENTEQNLKQRLNQATLLLDQERRRNGALKGA